MSLADDLAIARAEVARIESEIASLPDEVAGKSEEEMAVIFHSIAHFFKGTVPSLNDVAQSTKV